MLNATGELPRLLVHGDIVCWEVIGMRHTGILGKSAEFHGVEGDNRNGHFIGKMLMVGVGTRHTRQCLGVVKIMVGR